MYMIELQILCLKFTSGERYPKSVVKFDLKLKFCVCFYYVCHRYAWRRVLKNAEANNNSSHCCFHNIRFVSHKS